MSKMMTCVLPDNVLADVRRDTIGRLLHVTALGYFSHARNHVAVRPDPLDQHILIVCIEGSGWYRIDEVEHAIHAPSVVIVPAGVPHEYGSSPTDPWSIYWVHFAGSLAHEHSERLQLRNPEKVFSKEGVRQSFDDLWSAVDAGWSRETIAYANHLLWRFIGMFTCSLPMTGGDADPTRSRVSAKAQAYMKRHLSATITLRDLAEDAGLSVSRFSTRFRQETGSSPIDHLIQLRLRQAMHLLDTTDLRIGEVGSCVGYDNLCHFSKIFTRFVGGSPRSYRSQVKG